MSRARFEVKSQKIWPTLASEDTGARDFGRAPLGLRHERSPRRTSPNGSRPTPRARSASAGRALRAVTPAFRPEAWAEFDRREGKGGKPGAQGTSVAPSRPTTIRKTIEESVARGPNARPGRPKGHDRSAGSAIGNATKLQSGMDFVLCGYGPTTSTYWAARGRPATSRYSGRRTPSIAC